MILAQLLLLVVVLLVIYCGKQLVDHLVLLFYIHKIPGPPKRNVFLGNLSPLMDTQEKAFQVLKQWSSQYYPIYKGWILHIASVNILNPDDMQLVLSNIKHVEKSVIYNICRQWLQGGVLISNYEKWVHRRKLLTPTFHFSILQKFLQVFNDRTGDLVETLKAETSKPYTEVNGLMTNLALQIIGETAMGQKIEFNSPQEKAYEKALHNLSTIMIYRLIRTYLVYKWTFMFTWNYFRELKLVKILHDYTTEMIRKREKIFLSQNSTKTNNRMAMLDLLLTKKAEGVIDEKGIREEVDTVIFGGHDTVATAMSFGLMAIASEPKIQEEIVQEMREVLGDIKRKPSYEELQELCFMERCIKEILRLYPSATNISRVLGEDVVTKSGYKLKKNTIALLFIYEMHHSPEVYPDPEKFDPDRFLPENCKNRHPYAYLPFSAGPRNCLGQKFAMLEMKAILCGILGNFILQAVDTPEKIVLIVDVVLRSKDNIKVKFVPRVS